MEPVSVIVLSGFVAAGKTALVRRLVDESDAERVAVIELSSGCDGCSFRRRLTEAVERAARAGQLQTILVECSGSTDPLVVADAFELEDAAGRRLSSIARLDHLVTVVDAVRFWEDYESGDTLGDRGLGRGLDDERALSELLANQVECCTTLVLSKTDLVSDSARHRLERFLRRLNPDAGMLMAPSRAALWPVLQRAVETDEDRSSPTPGWMHLLTGPSLVEQDSEDGTTVVYRARRPFHPFRFWTLMQQEWRGVLRSKGYFWLASQPATCYMWSQAGGACLYERLGRWWMAIPDAHWPKEPEALEELRQVWDLEFGDRRIELALIGEDIDQADLAGRLEACLLTRDELRMDEELWRAFRDPFKKPSWEKRQVRSVRQKPLG